MNKHHCGPATPPSTGPGLWTPSPALRVGRAGLKVTYQTAALWSLWTGMGGRKRRGRQWNPADKLHNPPTDSSSYPSP